MITYHSLLLILQYIPYTKPLQDFSGGSQHFLFQILTLPLTAPLSVAIFHRTLLQTPTQTSKI